MNAANPGFSIAAFAFDGELVGQDFWHFSKFDRQALESGPQRKTPLIRASE